ncbi:MAG: Rrf2 family transcriptional regulator, partial [Lachnospiraceae bacterium]|nr:Rrf2 family transcriptional regulator [Lachnospiraceae bacterium]
RQDISLKYLERILPMLVKAKLIEGVHGKGGGYHLTRKPAQYTVGEILRLTEGDLAPVSCLDCKGPECNRKAECRTLPMWEKIDKIVNDYFDSVTIEDLMYKDITANI